MGNAKAFPTNWINYLIKAIRRIIQIQLQPPPQLSSQPQPEPPPKPKLPKRLPPKRPPSPFPHTQERIKIQIRMLQLQLLSPQFLPLLHPHPQFVAVKSLIFIPSGKILITIYRYAKRLVSVT